MIEQSLTMVELSTTGLHQRIAARMSELKMRQSDLVKGVGVSRMAVSNWLSGKTTPRGENLRKLCSVLQTTVYGVLEYRRFNTRQKMHIVINNYLLLECLSQEELAKLIGVSRVTMGLWLKGVCEPSETYQRELSRVLQIPNSDLVSSPGSERPTNQLRKIRKKQGISQKDLARELKITTRSVFAMETGVLMPDDYQLSKLSLILNQEINIGHCKITTSAV